MSTFFKRTKHTLCGLVIDIGSGSVSASIVLSERKKKLPEILYTDAAHMPIARDATPAEQACFVRQALFLALRMIERQEMHTMSARGEQPRIGHILVCCSAPWSHTVTQMIHFEQDTPFVVTPRLITDIIQHADETTGAHSGGRTSAPAQDDQHIIEKTIIDVTLNGYPVRDPYHTEAQEMTLAHLRGLTPTHILASLKDVEEYLHTDRATRVHTSASVLYCVLRDRYPDIKNALIIDSSGEATEIALMQNSVWHEAVTVLYGTNSLIRDSAALGNTIPEEARGHLRTYKQNILSETQEKILTTVQEKYARLLNTAVSELATRYVVPQTFFLVLDHTDISQFLIETIKDALRGTGKYTEQQSILISPEQARDFATLPRNAASAPRHALGAYFFHMVHTQSEVDT